jgi:hypothetical protein
MYAIFNVSTYEIYETSGNFLFLIRRKKSYTENSNTLVVLRTSVIKKFNKNTNKSYHITDSLQPPTRSDNGVV